MIETFLTILSVVERATHLYDWFTGLSSGRKRDENLNKIGSDVIVLSDNLIYAPRFVQAINTKQNISWFGLVENTKWDAILELCFK
jgi:hypothetical protein